jgi:hypothetical protein
MARAGVELGLPSWEVIFFGQQQAVCLALFQFAVKDMEKEDL